MPSSTPRHSRIARVAALTVLVVGLSAAAEVSLENTVQKVERYLDASGEVRTRLLPAEKVIPGDELRYTIVFENVGADVVDADSVVITNRVPENTEYIDGTAFGAGTTIAFSVDDGNVFQPPSDLTVIADGVEIPASAQHYDVIRWTFGPELKPGQKGHVSFNVRLK